MPAPNLTDIDNFFRTRKNQYEDDIRSLAFQVNPFADLYPTQPFQLEDGLTPEVVTATHELPTSYPFGLTAQPIASGTGNPATVDATVIKSGSELRSFGLEATAFQSEVIDLNTMQWKHRAMAMVKAKEQGLKDYATTFMADWSRTKNIGMVDTKWTTTGPGAVDAKSDSLYTFAGLTLPTHYFSWRHADAAYEYLVSVGAGAAEFRIGQAEGEPVFSMIVGPGYKRELFGRDEDVREVINYSADSMKNFIARGIKTAVNGLAPNCDQWPIRYKVVSSVLTPIHPFTNIDASTGRKWKLNPAYKTVANGGEALYEVITITARNVYTVKPRPIGPTAFSKATFGQVSYAGEVNWINNKDMAANIHGNLGFYRMDFQMGARPEYPQMAVSILTKAMDAN
jgi:hypothetical protein